MSGKIIAVFSPVGGLGVTTIACHLARSFTRGNKNAAIVDLVRDFGAVSDVFCFRPPITLDLIGPGEVHENSSSLKKLAHPANRNLFLFVDNKKPQKEIQIGALLQSFRECFPVTVIDLPHSLLAKDAGTVFEQADKKLVVCEYNWASILRTRIFLDGNKHLESVVVMNKVEWLPHDVIQECKNSLSYRIDKEFPLLQALVGRCRLVNGTGFDGHIKQFVSQLGRGTW